MDALNEYPKMMYRRDPNGKHELQTHAHRGALKSEHFDAEVAHSPEEEQAARDDGWFPSHVEAHDAYEKVIAGEKGEKGDKPKAEQPVGNWQ